MGLFGGGGSKTTTTSTSDVASWLRPYFQQIASEAQKQYGQEYPTYDISLRQAPLSQQTLSGMSFLNDTAYNYVPSYDQGVDILQQAGGVSGLDAYQSYMDPYLNDVLAASQSNLTDQYARDLAKQTASRDRVSAFGGSRQAVAEDLLRQSFADKSNELQTSGRSAAYKSAWDTFLADQQNQQQSALNLIQGSQAAQQGIMGAGAQQLAVGETLDTRAQNIADMTYEDFMNRANWDRSKLQDYSNIIYPQGSTFATNTQTSQTKSGGSTFGKILGAAVSLGSLAMPGGGTIAGSLFSRALAGGGMVDGGASA